MLAADIVRNHVRFHCGSYIQGRRYGIWSFYADRGLHGRGDSRNGWRTDGGAGLNGADGTDCASDFERTVYPGKFAGGLYAAAGQASKSNCDRPHPQHSKYYRINMGNRIPMDSVGGARMVGDGQMGAADFQQAVGSGAGVFCYIPCCLDRGEFSLELAWATFRTCLRNQRAEVGKLDGRRGEVAGTEAAVWCSYPHALNWIVRRWPRRYWFVNWLVTLPILVLVVFVTPLLSPIFDKFEPLQKNYPALVTELEKVVARTGTNIPPDRMYLMKASLKTNGLNAYVNGIGATKRIVVWDTTAGKIPNDEVLFIFGHESGHYVLNHVQKYLAIYSVGLFFVYWACAGFATWMVTRFGKSWGTNELQPTDKDLAAETAALASRTGFVVLLFAISIVSFLLQPVGNGIGRHYEHQADVYGQEAIHGIVPDPQKTTVAVWEDDGKAWLQDPHPSPLIEFWLYNHPSMEKRANFAAHYDPWKDGGHGEFFKN